MPEINFQIQWPDGSQEVCYSPSLIVKEYFSPDREYDMKDFVERSRTALKIASDRVLAKYGFPCSRALGQLSKIEARAAKYTEMDKPVVKFMEFIEPNINIPTPS
jgi:uncharacterized repeat protein (TIGR04042 family)